MAEALYRKYRPQIFEDVVGQEHIERTIKNAIEQDKVSHAYLFTGPRGTGKTTTARLLAKALLCGKGPTAEPDGTCENCLEIANGTHPDVYELDAASRTGVENVREEIIGRVQFAPTRGRSKVYIIDEVHMLSTAAFNALLKTLEEPPSHVVFILCTTDPQKVPETIHSRCQRFDFRRISAEAMVSRLGAICVAEGVEFEGDALDLIAYRAEGGMRNALTSLEQVIAFGEGKVTLECAERLLGSLDTNDMAEIVRFIGARDIASCFTWTAEYIETGADLALFTRDLAEHIRNMYVLALAGADTALEISEATRRELVSEMELFGTDRLARLLGVLGDLSAELRTSTNPRLSFEIALTRMVRPDSDLTLASLAERIEALESGYSAVSHVMSAPAAQVQPAAAAAAAPAQQAAPAAQTAAHSTAPTFDPVAESAAVQASPAVASADQAPATSATPVAAGGFDNPAALQRIWQAALASIKKAKAAYGVLFLNTKAVYDADRGGIVIEFPAENTFAFNAVQKPEVFEVVKASLFQASGTDISFSYTQGKGATASAQSGASGSAASASATAAAASAAVPMAARSGAVPTERLGANRPADQQHRAPSASARPSVAQQTHSAQPSRAAGSSAYAVPEDDRPPLDVYDDMYVPSEAEEAYAPVPDPIRASAPTASQLPNAAAQSAPAVASGVSSPQAQSQSQPPAQAFDAQDIESILAAGFGDGVTFEEVD